MSLGLHERRDRRRRKFWVSMVKWCFALILIAAAGSYSYFAGEKIARHEVTALETRVQNLEEERQALEVERATLEEKVSTAVVRAREWEMQYQKDIPTGEQRTFLELIQEKLDSGLSSKRLAFLISEASTPENCVADPQDKRFIVRTSDKIGANNSVTFDKSSLTVTAKGEAALSASGYKEGWFDVKKPLKVTFTRVGGEKSEASGFLPLHHAMITDGKEYRFTLRPGPRGFVVVTGQVCGYP